MITREEAFELLKKYNEEPFHIQHAETVEGTMRYFAEKLGYGDDVDFWGMKWKKSSSHAMNLPDLSALPLS